MTKTNEMNVSEAISGAFPTQPVVAVGAVVFKDGRVLLVKRGKPPARAMWAIPGGKVRLGETLRQAAEREIREETGIIIRAGEPVFTFEAIDTLADGRIRFHYVIIDLAAEYLRGTLRAGDDAQDARWVAPEELGRLHVNTKTLELLRNIFHFGIDG